MPDTQQHESRIIMRRNGLEEIGIYAIGSSFSCNPNTDTSVTFSVIKDSHGEELAITPYNGSLEISYAAD